MSSIVNIATAESSSESVTVEASIELALLEVFAEKAARDEPTTREATRTTDAANAATHAIRAPMLLDGGRRS
ncbi:MAG: hypothetical protein R2698_12500 [Microthrixaceae bacterium]